MRNIKLNVEKIKQNSIKLVCKAQEKSLIYKEKAKAISSLQTKNGDEDGTLSIHFNFHYFVTLIIIALLAFFIVFYSTSFNTKAVAAYDEVETTVINKEAIDVNYGDTKAIAEVAKSILQNDVSEVEQLKTITATSSAGVYELGEYVINVMVENPSLGKHTALLTIENKADFMNADSEKIIMQASDEAFVSELKLKSAYQVSINMIDTIAPVIHLSENEVTLQEDESFDIKNYVKSIQDNLDGTISEYSVDGEVKKDGDALVVGEHSLVIHSKDSSGNQASANLKVVVEEKEEVKVQETNNYGSYAESAYAGSIVAEARSHIGKAYVYGSNGPNAFDCSGLVQYVYARSGLSVPRTSSTQSYVGVAINPNDVSQWRAGDIVTFGSGGVSHAAIYSGNGTYIHALNPSQGVQETGLHGYFGPVFAVRRVQ